VGGGGWGVVGGVLWVWGWVCGLLGLCVWFVLGWVLGLVWGLWLGWVVGCGVVGGGGGVVWWCWWVGGFGLLCGFVCCVVFWVVGVWGGGVVCGVFGGVFGVGFLCLCFFVLFVWFLK
jgi:hypothetical protein